jgi:hemoglobin/transferrin/lactoferrin receptor protein
MIDINFVIRKIALVFLIFFYAHLGLSQQITIKDATLKTPVYNASITLELNKKIIFSNQSGLVVLQGLVANEIITISHPSFEGKTILGQAILNGQTEILLEERVIEIDEVVISANKWEQNKREVPNEITSISAKQIALKNPQTSADMLSQTGQIFVQKSQMGGGSPMIRGFSANSILIMMDGIRINNAIYRSGNLQNIIMLDPNLLESSEVIFGPGSSVYGSDALGGVMDFHTIKPRYTNVKKANTEGMGMMRFASANKEYTGHVHLTIKNRKWSNTFGYSYSSFSDLRSGGQRPSEYPDFGKRLEYAVRINNTDLVVKNNDVNLQRFSGYNQFNLMNKLAYRISDKSELSYTIYHTSSSNIPRYDRLIQRNDDGNLKYAAWYYGPQEFLLNAFTFSNFNTNALYDGLKITLSNQRINESRNSRNFNSQNLSTRLELVDVYALNIDVDKKLNYRQELYYGVEYIINDVTSTAKRLDINTGLTSPESTRYPDGGSRYSAISAYSSYKNILLDQLVLTAGIRYSNVGLESLFIDKSFYDFPYEKIELNNDAVSGTLGLVILPSTNLKWNLLFSTGFRAPNVDDVGKVFDSEPGTVVVPNEALGPEYTYNYETSVNWKIKNKITLDGSIYYTDMKDAMVRRPFTFNGDSTILYEGVESNVNALVNVGQAYIWGWSIGFSAKISNRFTLKGRVNNNDGKDKIDNTPLRHTNPLFGNTSLAYQRKKLFLELYSDFQAKRGLDDFAPSELNKPHLYTQEGSLAWYTINIRSSYEFNDWVSITAAVENILDKHYRPYSSGISAPGINAVVSARINF